MLHKQIEADTAPLVVDLDGSLITSDLAMESLVEVATRSVRLFFTTLALLLLAPRAKLKAYLALHDRVDPARLVYRDSVVQLINEARAVNRPIILASAAHRSNVKQVADHLGLFDQYLGSTSRRNLRGMTKLSAICAATGNRNFDYIGDSKADLPIWSSARIAYTVGRPTKTENEVRLIPPRSFFYSLIKAARPHQWAKNALVFVPLVTSGNVLDPMLWTASILSFVCLSVIASSVYLLNDVLDIRSDRRHATKRKRPIAAGELEIPRALCWSVSLAFAGLLLAASLLNTLTIVAISTYFVLTLAYSLRVKAAMIADVLTLATLYTIRLVVGAAAIAVAPSMWLLMFSIFFFLSLGYLKRFVELSRSHLQPDQLLSGRGYIASDTSIVAISGVGAGMVSILVILLFAAEMEATAQYTNPALLWLLAIPLLYWFNRVWIMATRGEVDGDPVAFALKDRRSMIVGCGLATIILCAKYAPAVPMAAI